MMKLKDLKIGQKVTIRGVSAEYEGIKKVKISIYSRVEKRVFKEYGANGYKFYNLNEGFKTLESQHIILLLQPTEQV